MSWVSRLIGRLPSVTVPADPYVNAACTFCGRRRSEVRKLIAGQNVYICDGCLTLSVQIVDEEMLAAEGRSYHVDLLFASVDQHGLRAPHATSRPALRAVIELAAGAPTVLRRVLAAASRLDDLVTALAALDAIPVDQRTIDDRLNRAATLSNAFRWSEALAVLDTIDVGALVGTDVILYRLHLSYSELELGKIARPRIAVHRATALELEKAIAALPAGGYEDAVRAERLAVLTLASLALGDRDDAEAAARERVAQEPTNASGHELLARVLAGRGDKVGAEAALALARQHAHPDGPLARRLADSGTPFR